jgi:hypothetical protein
MTTIISRLFATDEAAAEAVAALRRKGFTKSAVEVHAGGVTSLPESIVTSLKANGVPESTARHIARAAQGGAALVVARAGFGQAAKAKAILDDLEPLSMGDITTDVYVQAHYPTPTSPARYLPVLPSKSWLIFSEGIFPPALIRNDRPSSAILLNHKPKASLLTSTPYPFSMTAGLPLLSRSGPRASLLAEPFPLSSLFRFPMLIGESRHKSA